MQSAQFSKVFGKKPRLRRLSFMAMLGTFCLTNAIAEAQGIGKSSGGSTSAGQAIDFDNWRVELTILLVATLLFWLFAFVALFPALLTKSRPSWPRTAYGTCIAATLTFMFVLGGALFWEDLQIPTASGVPVSFWFNRAGQR